MRTLKYFQYLFFIITVWFFWTGASFAEENPPPCKTLLDGKKCDAPPFITKNYAVGIPCLSYGYRFYKVCLKPIGLNEWRLQLSNNFEEISNNTDDCEKNFITHCATVLDSVLINNLLNDALLSTTPSTGFIQLPDVDLSGLGFSGENKMLNNSVVLEYKKLEKNKEIPKNNDTVFSVTLEEQSDKYSSYGTLKPLSKGPSVADQTKNKKLLAIYMVGSTLEEKNNLASKDLRELIKGYSKLLNPEVNIIIAFGGSNKKGWQGVKFVDIKQAETIFINENETNETGNYLYEAKYANMGDKSTLEFFLGYLQKYFSTDKPKFLVFWDHGASYNGFGNDQVYHMDSLSLEEMKEAFEESNIPQNSFDLVGFDACLMGSIEVAQVFQPYAKYLLASEDLESGEGWNWEKVIEEYVLKTETKEAAKAIIDDFAQGNSTTSTTIDSSTINKTLSVVDLSKFDDLIDKFNSIASAGAIALNQMKNEKIKEGEQYKPDPSKVAFLKAIMGAHKYGENENISNTEFRGGSSGKGGSGGKGSITTSIDLNHFANIIKDNANDGTIIGNSIGLSDAIVKSDDDKSYVIKKNDFPDSYGVSFGGFEEGVPSLSGTIEDFQKAFRSLREIDTTYPTIKEYPEPGSTTTASDFFQTPSFQQEIIKVPRQGNRQVLEIPFLNGERTNFIYVNNNNSLRSGILNLDEIEGIAAKITDDLYVARVTTLFGKQESTFPDEINVIAEVEAYPATIENYKDYYFTPMWNQKWYVIKYGEGENDFQTIPLSFKYRYNGNKGTTYTRYSTSIDYVREEDSKSPPQDKLKAIAREFEEIQSKAKSYIYSSKYSPFYYDNEGEWYYQYPNFYFITYDGSKGSYSYSFKDEEKNEFEQRFYDQDKRLYFYQLKHKDILFIYFGDDHDTWLYLSKKVSEPIPVDKEGLDWKGPLTEGRLDLIVNNESTVVNYGIRSVEQLYNNKGKPYLQFDKNVQTLKKGDSVVFYAEKLVNDKAPVFEPIEIRTFTHDIPSKGIPGYFQVKDLEPLTSGDEYVYAIKAEDINNNIGITRFKPLSKIKPVVPGSVN